MQSTDDKESVLRQYAPLIARTANSFEADLSLREDLIQEISLAVWKALESFQGQADIKTFIARVAHNQAVNHVVKESRRQDKPTHETFEINGEDKSSKNQEFALDFISALRKLRVGYRQVIMLQLEGFSYAEIANIIGISEANVAQRASRGKQQLEQLINRRS